MKFTNYWKQSALCILLIAFMQQVCDCQRQENGQVSSADPNKNTFQFNQLELLAIQALSRLREIYGENWINQLMVAFAFPLLAPFLVRSAAIGRSDPLSSDEIINNLSNAHTGHYLHGLSMLPLTLPMGFLRMMKVPIQRRMALNRRSRRSLNDDKIDQLIYIVEQLDELYKKYQN